MDYRYKQITSGDFDRPTDFYDYLNIMKYRCRTNNQLNTIFDPYGEYATKYGIQYYPQPLFFGQVYFLGEKYLFESDDPYQNYGIGFAKLIGVERINSGTRAEELMPMIKDNYDFFVFEFCNSKRVIKVRPGSVIVGGKEIIRSAYLNHYSIPKNFKDSFMEYCPGAIAICGIEKEDPKPRQYKGFRVVIDLVLFVVFGFMFFSYLEWNIMAILILGPCFGLIMWFQCDFAMNAIKNMFRKTNKSKKPNLKNEMLNRKLSYREKEELFRTIA